MRLGNLEAIAQKSAFNRLYYQLFGLPHYGSQVRFSIIKNLLKVSQDSTILDIGCGDGPYLNYASYMYGSSGLGIDRLDNRLSVARRVNAHYKLHNLYIEGDVNRFLKKKVKNKYDYVLLIEVLEHLKNPQDAVARCFKLLKRKGKIILCSPIIPKHKWLFDIPPVFFDYGKDNHLVDGFTEKQLKHDFINNYGKIILRVETFKVLAQVLWEISEKLRRHQRVYRFFVPILYFLSLLDGKLSPKGTHSGLILVAQKTA
jgi:2-polyprenyl-3-methyl-5-hydroxy-6-metoxy-1,4-benzoquinol methylase